MKKLISIIIIIAVMVGLWFSVKGFLSMRATFYGDEEAIFDGLEEITTEENFETALQKQPQKYILNGIKVYGKEVCDTFGLFKKPHLAIIFKVFQKEIKYKNGKSYENWIEKSPIEFKSDTVLLFNKYKFCWKPAKLTSFDTTVSSEDIVDDHKGIWMTGTYMPIDFSGYKYVTHKLDNGGTISFVATIGGNHCTIEPIDKGLKIAIGDKSNLLNEELLSGKISFFVFLIFGGIFILGIAGLIIWICLKAFKREEDYESMIKRYNETISLIEEKHKVQKANAQMALNQMIAEKETELLKEQDSEEDDGDETIDEIDVDPEEETKGKETEEQKSGQKSFPNIGKNDDELSI